MSHILTIAVLAATRWVSPSGSDTNPGTEAAPFRTPAKLEAVMAPGDVGNFQPGLYAVTCPSTSANALDLVTAGTATAPITFQAVQPGTAIIDSANTCAYGIKAHIGADYNIVSGLVLYHHLIGGIQAQGSHDDYLEPEVGFIGNISDPSTTTAHVGILTYSGSDSTLIRAPKIHHIGRTNTMCGTALCTPRDQLLYLEGTHVTAINGDLWLNPVGSGGWGIALKVGSFYTITGNTIHGAVGNGRPGQIVMGDDLHTPLSNLTLQSNTCIDPFKACIVPCGVALQGANVVANNIVSGTGVIGVLGTDFCSPSTGLSTISASNNHIVPQPPPTLTPMVP